MTWLTDLIDKLFSFVPRLFIVGPDQSGVRVTLGTRIKACPSGWYIHWPILQECEAIGVKVQVKDLRAQSVWTSDGHELCVSGAIRYRVSDATKAILEVFDYDQNLQAVALGIIQSYVGKHDVDAINTGVMADTIIIGLREESRGWGLKVEKVYITDIGKTNNLRLLLNQPLISNQEV